MRKIIGVVVLAVIVAAAFVLIRGFGSAGTVVLSGARAEVSATPDAVDVFVTLQNAAQPDLLLGASSSLGQAVLIGADSTSGVPVPANGSVSFSSDGVFVRLTGLQDPPEVGQLIPLTLQFAASGDVSSRALVGEPADPHAAHMAAGMMMGAPLLDDGQPVPTISMVATPQDDGRWAVTLTTSDFTFDPDSPDPVHVAGHGHAHLYLGGIKVQRMHGPSTIIGALPQGEFTLRAALNSNDHRPYMDDTGPVAASVDITVERR